MAEFGINVIETSYGFVEVEADSPEEARTKVEEQYHKGNIHWSSSEFVSREAEKN